MLEFIAYGPTQHDWGLVRMNEHYYNVEISFMLRRLQIRRLRLEANRRFVFTDETVMFGNDVGQEAAAWMGFEDRLYVTYANGDLYSYQMDGTSQYLRAGFSGPFAIIRGDPYVLGASDLETAFNIRTGEEVVDRLFADYGGQFSLSGPFNRRGVAKHYTVNGNTVFLPNAIRQLLIYDDNIAIATTNRYTVVLRSVDDGRDPFRDTVNALIRIYDVDRTPALERALAECQAMRRRDADALARSDRDLAETVAQLADRDARLAIAGDAAEACSVCMERPRTHTYGPCGHVFCADCIAAWPHGCPQCRGPRDSRPLIYP